MANELKYGDRMHLQNGYNNFGGGYLDTNGHAPSGKYGVSTNSSPARDSSGTGTWAILSATGKATGQPVLSGELIHLRNLYGAGSYLDTNGHASTVQQRAGGMFDVLTSETADRAPGTGRWRIFGQTSASADRTVRIGDVLLLWNTYADNGGFLETNNTSTASSALYDVCTNAHFNRASDVAYWKAQLV